MEFRINFSARGHQYTQEECDLVVDVMKNADALTQSVYRDAFEKKYSEYLGVDHSFAVMNATAAIEMSAQLAGIRPGDEIIAPAHTFTSSVYPLVKKGGIPVWADIDPVTRVVSPEAIEALITPRTKLILVVHLYGYVADMPAIMEIAARHGIMVMEDNAQSFGAEIGGKKAGSFGDISVTSFHSHKNITTLGEGGMLSVKDPEVAAVVPMVRHNGHCAFNFDRPDYWLPAMGNLDLPRMKDEYLWPNNYCLGEVECALGAKLMDRLDTMNDERRARAMRFIDALAEYPEISFHRDDSRRHVYHQLVAHFPTGLRDAFMRKMADEKKIKCIVPYYPLNRYDFYKRLGFGKADIPHTDHFFDNMSSLPFQHWMSEEDFEYMLASTTETLNELRQA